jgi:DnaJ-class molecular chaperone
MAETYYSVLGVEETATQDEIKKAYRGLSLKWHPDRNSDPEAQGKSQKINEAYENLGEEQKRREYDASRNGRNPFFRMQPGMQPGMHPGMPPGMHPGMPHEMDNIFQAFFGGGGIPGFNMFNGSPINFVQQGLQKPTPIIMNIVISIDQVYNGVTLPIEIDRWLVENNNKVFERETAYVTIPKGIDDGEIIVLREKGNIINQSNRGDVKIFIKVEPSPIYQRRGLDLFMTQKISLKDALCGFTFELNHINGKVYTLNNNAGTIVQPEYKKIIPNMGVTRDDHTGNLVLTFNVEFPTTLTPEQITTLKETL